MTIYFILMLSENCVEPLTPINGAKNGSIQHGGKVTFTCNAGYELFGDQVIACYDGNFNGSSPVCQGK